MNRVLTPTQVRPTQGTTDALARRQTISYQADEARVDILGVGVNAQPFTTALDTLTQWASQPGHYRVSTCAVYTVMLARENSALQATLSSADMVTADGMPLVWLQHIAGHPQAGRVYGPDLMHALCARTAADTDHTPDKPVRHLFYGGQAGVAQQLADRLQTHYPGLQIAGAITPPPDMPIDAPPDPAVVEQLNAAQATIIWVGLGSPKQDFWMATYRPFLHATILIGVGAAFDILSGNKRQAPRWMQRHGLEWSFRLMQEPKRLWRRYLIYNPRFLLAVLRRMV
ncbi:MAG: WecB/TagA/CpsF family glycosyltransferase [Anaerolineae bacterium]|nr:WecB/TagA/CpsF family glycosyltransferase [Anaerolineae bacterium]